MTVIGIDLDFGEAAWGTGLRTGVLALSGETKCDTCRLAAVRDFDAYICSAPAGVRWAARPPYTVCTLRTIQRAMPRRLYRKRGGSRPSLVANRRATT